MKGIWKKRIQSFLPLADRVLLPLLYPAAWLMRSIRKAGVHKLPKCRNVLMKLGVFPIHDHYYEPQFNYRNLEYNFDDRPLPGIDWNVSRQLEILETFRYSHELKELPKKSDKLPAFDFGNNSFRSGDAEYWYQLIRASKPRRIIEVGSGHSTLMAIYAIDKNCDEDPEYSCEHICIEPYEMPWLEESNVTVIRKKIEDIETSFFSSLSENDILFIDSSHVIRPQGDVLFLYLELLPVLNTGVMVHIHDIFSPKNYPADWLQKNVRFWNEQYVLEAFLTQNKSWEIVGALNHLCNHHYNKLKTVAPYLTPDRDPGSFYIQKTNNT